MDAEKTFGIWGLKALLELFGIYLRHMKQKRKHMPILHQVKILLPYYKSKKRGAISLSKWWRYLFLPYYKSKKGGAISRYEIRSTLYI